MDEQREDARVPKGCQGNKQNCLSPGENAVNHSAPSSKDSGKKVEELSAHIRVVNEEEHPATLSADIENVLDPPVFGLQCPCGPQCKTFMADIHSPDCLVPATDAEAQNACLISVDNTEMPAASDVFACKSEKTPLHASDYENLKMEYESSVGALHDEEVENLEESGCCQQNVLLSGEDMLTLQGDRFCNEFGRETCQDEKDNEFRKNGICDTSHPYLGGLRLDELDDDTILHIASHMEARSVRYGLSHACQRFQDIFDNDAYWKTRINMKWQKRYPAVPAPDDFSWEDVCIAGEDCQRVWSNPDEHTHHLMYECNVYGEVDTVHLMQQGKLLLSGDRNRNLNIINLAKYNPECGAPSTKEMEDMLVLSNSTIHKGWIWSVTSVDNHVMTGSWDTRIRIFDMNSDLQNFTAYKCRSAVLSLYAEENDIVASCFDRKVYFFDRRSGDCNIRIFHKQAVMSVAGNQDYIISGSEDKTVSVYDRRAGKVLRTIKLNAYPLCLSFQDNQLWLGDKSGLVHLYDASERMFNHIGTYDVGHKEKVTDIIYTPGSLFTCSGDKTLKVLTPTRDPGEIHSFDVHKKELAKIDYSCGVLASAGGDESIGVWLPRNWGKDAYLL